MGLLVIWISYCVQITLSEAILPDRDTVMLSHIHLFETLWTVPVLCPWDFFQARILGWLTISSSRGSSWSRDWTRISCLLHCKWILYYWAIREPLKRGFYYWWHPGFGCAAFLTISRSWWWTGRPGMLQFMGSQRVGHNWATDLIWSDLSLTWQA